MGPFRDGWTMADVDAVLARGDAGDLLYVPIVISMDPIDCARSQEICLMLAGHCDTRVRANAILGLGHLARTCRALDASRVRPLLARAQNDPDAAVRCNVETVRGDLRQFLGWI